MSSPLGKLVLAEAFKPRKNILIDKNPFVIGRTADCDLMLARAWLDLAQNENDSARSFCDDVLVFEPDRAVAYRIRGLAAANQGSNDAAAQDLRRAIELDESFAEELRPRLEKIEGPSNEAK